MEGWGIKNIFQFGSALATKSLWRGLFSKGMWSDVLKTKYLKQENVYEWIRNENKRSKGNSNSWNYLLNSFLVVKDWLAWKPMNGHNIRIGLDPMFGATSFYIL